MTYTDACIYCHNSVREIMDAVKLYGNMCKNHNRRFDTDRESAAADAARTQALQTIQTMLRALT